MKAQELRQKTKEELDKELKELYREKFNLRMQKGKKQNTNVKSHQFKRVRHDIARIKTILHEKERTL